MLLLSETHSIPVRHFFQSVLRRLDALVIRPGIQKPAIHISNQTNPITYKALHLRNIHVSLGIQGMQGVRGTLDELLKNRPDVFHPIVF